MILEGDFGQQFPKQAIYIGVSCATLARMKIELQI